jgi:hypothetical protein
MEENNQIAMCTGTDISLTFGVRQINIDLYVPAEHDEMITHLYRDGRLSEEDILWADCQIIKDCHCMFIYNWSGISNGMQVEIDFCKKHNIPMFEFTEFNQETADKMVEFLDSI